MIRMLVSIPIIAIILVFAFVNNDMVSFSLWPFDIEVTSSFSVIVVALILIGYVLGRISGWFAYLPLRKNLVVSKMQNKKLCKTIGGLQGDISSLKKETVKEPICTLSEEEERKASPSLFARLFKSPEKH